MMMKMISVTGIEIVTDKIREADEDNPKGYFEFERVKELDKGGDKSWVADMKGKAVKIISFLLTDLPDDCAYKVIFMQRHLDEVLASQNKMLVRRNEDKNQTDDDRLRELYTKHLRKVKYMLANKPNFESLDVDFKQAMEDPQRQAVRVNRFLGGGYDVEKMAGVTDQKLYRNRR